MSCQTACGRSFTISATYEPVERMRQFKAAEGPDGEAQERPSGSGPQADVASVGDDRHDAGPEAWRGRAALQAFLQSGLEAIDEDAGRGKAGEFERRRGAEHKHGAKRKAFEVESDRCDVLAEISGADFESGPLERIEQFARDEMDLPEVGCLWIPPREVTVPHERSVMRITFNAMAARQCDR